MIFKNNRPRMQSRMMWTPEKIKILRCRLGWTQSELARKLKCELELIGLWESSQCKELVAIESHIEGYIDALILLEKQAEMAADQVVQCPLAESILDENKISQVDMEVVKRRFYENN